jgi:hypothetical protein
VQVVDVLGDHEQPVAESLLEPHQGVVGGVRRDAGERRPPPVVERVHQLRLRRVGLGRRDLLDAVPFPETVRPAEGRHAALCRDAGAGEDDDAHDQALVIDG